MIDECNWWLIMVVGNDDDDGDADADDDDDVLSNGL